MSGLRLLMDARKARDFGIGRYILGLLRSFDRSRKIALAALVKSGEESLLPASVECLPTGIRPYSLRELLLLGRRARQTQADLVHWPHYVVPFGTPRPAVVTIHDLMHLTEPEHGSLLKRTYAGRMMRRAVEVAEAVIAVSEHTARQIAAHFPAAEQKLEVIWNGVDDVFFSPVNATGPPVDGVKPPYILYCGNDKPHKNLGRLFEAFAILRPGHPEVMLVLAGVPEASAPARRERTLELGIARHVVETGFVPDSTLASLMAGAEVFVLPSLIEGFGLPVLEAMAAGAPVACSNRGSLPEVAAGAALHFDPEDPREIAMAIDSILESSERRQELSRLGRRRAEGFSWEETAKKTLALYRRVTGSTT